MVYTNLLSRETERERGAEEVKYIENKQASQQALIIVIIRVVV